MQYHDKSGGALTAFKERLLSNPLRDRIMKIFLFGSHAKDTAGDDLPGSHGGLVGRFGELYIKTGTYEKELVS